jgi:hypothetical protein
MGPEKRRTPVQVRPRKKLETFFCGGGGGGGQKNLILGGLTLGGFIRGVLGERNQCHLIGPLSTGQKSNAPRPHSAPRWGATHLSGVAR